MKPRKLLGTLVAACLIACLTSAPALAGLGGFAGLSHPTGDLGDQAKMGYHLGGYFTNPLLPTVSIGGRLAYNHHGWEDTGGNFKTYELLAIGKVSLPMVGPFGMIGFGLSSSKATIDEQDLDRETDFTYAIGGGYKMTLLEFTLLYHSISADEGTSSYWTLSAGIGL